MLPCPRPKVCDKVCGPHHGFVMLNNNHSISQVLQAGQGADQKVVVVGMQADGRLVAHIEDASQPRSDLSSQSDALGLAAGQSAGRSIHRHVVQTDAFQEFDSPFNFF